MTIFVVAEGVDRAGKTTLLKEAMRLLHEAGMPSEYRAATKSDSLIGLIADHFPSTYSLFGQVWFCDRTIVQPRLQSGVVEDTEGILLMDRWWYSVAAYAALSRQEDYFARVVSKRLSKPDILVHVTVSLEERLSRLSLARSRAHDRLLKSPQLIVEYEDRLVDLMRDHHYVRSIDTTGKAVSQSARELIQIIDEYRNIEKPCLA